MNAPFSFPAPVVAAVLLFIANLLNQGQGTSLKFINQNSGVASIN
jgi:hypothetical protein